MEEECLRKIIGEEYWDFIFEYGGNRTRGLDEYENYCPQIASERYVCIYTDAPDNEEVSIDDFSYTAIPKLYGLMDLSAVENIGALRLQNITGFGLTGRGVIVGFVDTGIDYTNDLFITPTGETRIVGIWDQTISDGNPPDDFYYGSEYTSQNINEALNDENPRNIVPHIDTNGHGTYMAGVACGNKDLENGFTGVAPDSLIAMVKLKEAKNYLRDFYMIKEGSVAYQENDIMLAIRYLTNLAGRENKPLVIVLGLGTTLGDHAGGAPLPQMINELALFPGCCVVTCSGNEGNARLHYQGKIENGQEYDSVEVKVGENERGFVMELWAQTPDIFSIGIVTPFGEVVPRIPARVGAGSTIDFLLEETKIDIQYGIVESGNGAELIFIRFENPTPGIWNFRVYGENILDGNYNIWMPNRSFLSGETYFLRPSPNTTITEPGNATNVITVSAHNSENNAFYPESGRGYTRLNNIKPNMSAPGVNVTGPGIEQRIEGKYTRKSGTSVAAGLTAGVCAQFMEWGIVRGNEPYMKTPYIKNYLIRGATRGDDIAYPNRQSGYGNVNAYESFIILTTT